MKKCFFGRKNIPFEVVAAFGSDEEWKMRLRRESLSGAGAPNVFHALPAGAVFLLGQKKGRKKAPCYLGRLVIGGKKLITARSFRNRVLPLRSSAIPNKTLSLCAVSF
nr:hypothetical protein [uncultured Pseudodesulfovibrio sp.]